MSIKQLFSSNIIVKDNNTPSEKPLQTFARQELTNTVEKQLYPYLTIQELGRFLIAYGKTGHQSLASLLKKFPHLGEGFSAQNLFWRPKKHATIVQVHSLFRQCVSKTHQQRPGAPSYSLSLVQKSLLPSPRFFRQRRKPFVARIIEAKSKALLQNIFRELVLIAAKTGDQQTLLYVKNYPKNRLFYEKQEKEKRGATLSQNEGEFLLAENFAQQTKDHLLLAVFEATHKHHSETASLLANWYQSLTTQKRAWHQPLLLGCQQTELKQNNAFPCKKRMVGNKTLHAPPKKALQNTSLEKFEPLQTSLFDAESIAKGLEICVQRGCPHLFAWLTSLPHFQDISTQRLNEAVSDVYRENKLALLQRMFRSDMNVSWEEWFTLFLNEGKIRPAILLLEETAFLRNRRDRFSWASLQSGIFSSIEISASWADRAAFFQLLTTLAQQKLFRYYERTGNRPLRNRIGAWVNRLPVVSTFIPMRPGRLPLSLYSRIRISSALLGQNLPAESQCALFAAAALFLHIATVGGADMRMEKGIFCMIVLTGLILPVCRRVHVRSFATTIGKIDLALAHLLSWVSASIERASSHIENRTSMFRYLEELNHQTVNGVNNTLFATSALMLLSLFQEISHNTFYLTVALILFCNCCLNFSHRF
ncbi:MAG: hypothetical protein AAGI90_04775 [Chlamydiota bacterium]